MHISEFEDDSKLPEESFAIGDEIEVKILEINENDRSLRLSMK